uniref:Uncharacterized protein n=1 Tax=Cacopsylla melanoneura TaxID=428564 RepID=A0A8D8TPZ9_9HEMI
MSLSMFQCRSQWLQYFPCTHWVTHRPFCSRIHLSECTDDAGVCLERILWQISFNNVVVIIIGSYNARKMFCSFSFTILQELSINLLNGLLHICILVHSYFIYPHLRFNILVLVDGGSSYVYS